MKRLLLISLGILLFAGSFAAEVKEITGPTSVTSGDKQIYKVVFTEKLTVATQFIISIEKDAGIFDNGKSVYNEIISPGKSEIELLVTWSTSAEGKITITGGRGGGLPKTLAVTLKKSSSSLPISGPNIILQNTTETYQVPNENYFYPLEWIVDTNLLDIISGQGTYKIQVKAKKYIEKTSVSVKSKTLGGSIVIDSKEIKISPDFAITALERLVCQESEVSYAVTFPAGASVVWTPVERLSYVAGQGTATAKFKISGNGFAKVKAKVTYQGKEYNLENSDVWIGIPEKPTIQGFGTTPKVFPGKSRNTLRAGAAGADLTNGFIYSISGAASITQVLIGGEITIETNNVTYDSPFTIGVIACNKCGQSPIYYANGTVKGSGGGDEPPLIEMRGNFSIVDLKDQPEVKSVKVYNLSGVLVHSNDAVNGSFDIKSTPLSDGIYIIEKFDGENRTSEKVMLKR